METNGEPDVSCIPNDFSFAYDNAAFCDRVLQLRIKDSPVPSGQPTLTSDGTDACSSETAQSCRTRFIHVSSAILAGRSPYFMKLFGPSGFKESTQKNVTLDVLAEEERPMTVLLRFMFEDGGPVLDSVTDPTEIKTLLMLADRFEVRACAERCVRALARLPLTLVNSLLFLTLPESLQQTYAPLRKVVKQCSTFLVSNFKGLSQADHFGQLKAVPLPVMENLLKSDLMVEAEARVFEVFLAWIRSHHPADCKQERDEAVARLAPLIRFPFMPGEYLYDFAAKAPELDTPVGRDLINEALWYKAFSAERRQELAVTTMEHSRYRMRRYGHFLSFPFQFRLEQLQGLSLNGGSLQSPQFRVGPHEFDVKVSRCSRANDASTYAMFIGLWRVGSSTGTAECDLLVQTQPSGDFISPRGFVKGGNFPGPQQDWSFHDWLGIPWEEMIGPHSPYLKDGVMTIRADVLVLNPTYNHQKEGHPNPASSARALYIGK